MVRDQVRFHVEAQVSDHACAIIKFNKENEE
jgi:hypothetical protein